MSLIIMKMTTVRIAITMKIMIITKKNKDKNKKRKPKEKIRNYKKIYLSLQHLCYNDIMIYKL